jgi:hypothetical protein
MRLILILLSLSLLTACAAVKESTNVAPATEKGGLLGLGTKDRIETSGLQAVNGETRVVVPYFKIAFYTEDNPAGYSSDSSKVKIKSKLMGVDSQSLQHIADTAYKNFVSQMQEKGITVLPFSDLEKIAAYQDFKPNSHYVDSALFGPDATYVTPTGLKMSDASIMRGKEMMNLLNQTQTSLMDIQLNLTYLSQSVESTMRVVTGITIGQTLTVTPGSKMAFYGYEASKCSGYCPNTVANAKLGQPIYRAEKIGELRNVTTSSDTAGDIAVAALTYLSSASNMKFQDTNRYELHTEQGKYESVAIDVLKDATGQMVDALTQK